jgi:hypothetical protein
MGDKNAFLMVVFVFKFQALLDGKTKELARRGDISGTNTRGHGQEFQLRAGKEIYTPK